MVFALTRNDLNILFSRYNEKSSIFLAKELSGVKFIASILEVRKANEETCSIL